MPIAVMPNRAADGCCSAARSPLASCGEASVSAIRYSGQRRVSRSTRPTYSPMIPSTRNCPAPSVAIADMIEVQPATVWPIQRKLTIE